MNHALLIFLIAFAVRFINILFIDLDISNYLYEDQIFYWDWSANGVYTPWSTLEEDIDTYERVPGAFFFYQILMWITGKNLFFMLLLQILVDTFSCVILLNTAKFIDRKTALYVGLLAAFSPLLIILSSQILSDTLFFFFFASSLYFFVKLCMSEFKIYDLYFCALFIGLATFTRIVTFPLIFIVTMIVFIMLCYFNLKKIKIALLTISFLFVALSPISVRLIGNIKNSNTYALTNQSGVHVAYWILPEIFSFSKKFNRQESIEYIKGELYKKGFTDSTGAIIPSRRSIEGNESENKYKGFDDSKMLLLFSKEILSNLQFIDIVYPWTRGFIINFTAPSFLLDNRIRNLPHLSFYKYGKLDLWISSLTKEKKYRKYLASLILSALTSLFFLISSIIGFIIMVRRVPLKISFLLVSLVLYFGIITGPVISPKYILPCLPCFFYVQSYFLIYISNLNKKLYVKFS